MSKTLKRKLDAICDDCKKEFRIRKINKKKHKDAIEGNLTIEYFTCPHCKKKYVTFISNSGLRRMINERKRIYSSIKKLDAFAVDRVEEFEERIKQVQELDSIIKSRTDNLKFHFSKYV